VRALSLFDASPMLSALFVLFIEQKSVSALYVQPHDSTMALREGTETQERVDAAHHNVYNMHATGRAWLELVVRYDRSSHTLGRYR
jgi:hypothetical protein